MGRGHAGKVAVVTGAAAGIGRAFAHAVSERYAQVDILVDNAGIYPSGPFAEIPDERWRKVLAVNLARQRRIIAVVVRTGEGRDEN